MAAVVWKPPQQEQGQTELAAVLGVSLCHCGCLLTVQAGRLSPLESRWRNVPNFVSYVFSLSSAKGRDSCESRTTTLFHIPSMLCELRVDLFAVFKAPF